MPSRGQTPEEREYSHKRYYARGSRGARREWTLSELRAITEHGRAADAVLSIQLNRSIRAIQVARCRAGGSKR
jgi:hypothetical protein